MHTLYIHIGCHKTGSTSIQKSLMNNKDILIKHNLHLFTDLPNGEQSKTGNLGGWIDCKKLNTLGGTLACPAKLSERLKKTKKDTIISAEGFSWIFSKSELEKLRNILSPIFNKVIVIAYIRRQDKHLTSHYQQASKPKIHAATKFYGSSPTALPEEHARHKNYLDYFKRLSLWGDIFGDNNLIIRPFEKDRLLKGDVVTDFFSLLGINEGFHTYNKNQSQGFEATKVGHIINSNMRNSDLSSAIRKKLDNSGKLTPSKDEAIHLYNTYRASNTALNKRFNISSLEAIFDDDFSMYDTTTSHWSEATANQAISSILSTADNIFGKITSRDLLEAARTTKTTNPKLSSKLRRAAKRLEPKKSLKNRLQDELERPALRNALLPKIIARKFKI